MSKSFDEIVSNYKDPKPEWQVTINGSDYTKNLELLEFTNSVNNPLEFTLKTAGLEGRNTDLRQGAEVVIKNSGFELFRGVLQQVDASTDRTATLKGSGYSAELDGDVSQNFKSTTVTNVVNTLIDGTTTDTVTSRTFSTAFDLSSTINVDDFRVNKTQLQDVNRLMGEYSTEWYLSYDGANNPVFNVTDQILNDDGSGGTIGTITTYGTNQSAEVVKRNTNRNEGDYNGVIVRGYGDGDDQITATAGSTGKGNRVLIYTDKTILTPSQAQKRADNLLNSRSVPWREIRVKPNDPNKLYGIGDYLTVDAEDAKLDGDYRVIETYYKIYVGEEQVESKLVLSNKAQSFLSEFKTEEAKREGQTDHSQGARNTITESNANVADSSSGTTVEFNVPERFTTDTAGRERTAAVYLDYSVQNYKQLLKASNVTAINSDTQVYKTEVTNFGDVEKQYTEKDDFTESDMTLTPTAGGAANTGGGQASGIGYTVDTGDNSFEQGDSFTLDSSPAIQGFYVHVTLSGGGDSTKSTLDTLNSDNQETVYYKKFDLDGDGTDDRALTDSSGSLLDDFIVDDNTTFNAMTPDTGTNSQFVDMVVRVDGNDFYPNNGNSNSAGDAVPIRKWVKMGATGKGTVDFTVYVPGDRSGDTVDLRFQNVGFTTGDPDGESWAGWYTYYSVEKVQTPNATANEKLMAYTAASGGGNLDASVNANQNSSTLPNSNTTTFGKLDSNELVLQKQTTTADQVRVYLNGTEIENSPFSLSSGPPFNRDDIELTNDANATLTKPGFNTVEIVPEDTSGSTEGTAYVKGNVTVDHKLDAERT